MDSDVLGDVRTRNRLHLVVFGNEHFEEAKRRIAGEAERTGRIALSWEHSDTLDPFSRQAVFSPRMKKEPMDKQPLAKRIVYSIAKRICYPLFSFVDRLKA